MNGSTTFTYVIIHTMYNTCFTVPYVTYKWGWLQTRGRSGGRSSAKLGGRSRGECVGGARCDLLQMDWSISHCVIDFLQWNSIPPQLVFVVCWSTHWCGVQNKPLCRYPLCSMYPTHQVPPPLSPTFSPTPDLTPVGFSLTPPRPQEWSWQCPWLPLPFWAATVAHWASRHRSVPPDHVAWSLQGSHTAGWNCTIDHMIKICLKSHKPLCLRVCMLLFRIDSQL